MNWMEDYLIKTRVKDEKEKWEKLSSTSPNEFLNRVLEELYVINNQIKDIVTMNKMSDYEKDNFRVFSIIFGNNDFLVLIADTIINGAERDSDKTLLSIVNVTKKMSVFIAIYEEYKPKLWREHRKWFKPLVDVYINLYMLFTAAEIDLFQKVKSNDCPFNNLLNWLGNLRAWNVQLARAYKYGNT